MRFNQIRDFVSIVEAGSIRAAARVQGVSHPAMTKSLRQLEEDLRVQLIRRSTRGVVPTPSGRAFLTRARAIQAEVRKAEEELRELAGEAGGTVSISVSPAAAALLAPEAIAEFLRDHPQTRMRIVEGTPSALAPLVRDETLDFALGNRPATKLDARLKFRPLLHIPMVVAGRRGHPLRGVLRGRGNSHILQASASGRNLPVALLECGHCLSSQAASMRPFLKPRALPHP